MYNAHINIYIYIYILLFFMRMLYIYKSAMFIFCSCLEDLQHQLKDKYFLIHILSKDHKCVYIYIYSCLHIYILRWFCGMTKDRYIYIYTYIYIHIYYIYTYIYINSSEYRYRSCLQDLHYQLTDQYFLQGKPLSQDGCIFLIIFTHCFIDMYLNTLVVLCSEKTYIYIYIHIDIYTYIYLICYSLYLCIYIYIYFTKYVDIYKWEYTLTHRCMYIYIYIFQNSIKPWEKPWETNDDYLDPRLLLLSD